MCNFTRKDGKNDEKMLCMGMGFMPVAALVDFDLTMSLPARTTADTGIDALELNFYANEIDFEADGQKFHFEEKVKAYTLEDFQRMMNETGIYLLDTFGDYKLMDTYLSIINRYRNPDIHRSPLLTFQKHLIISIFLKKRELLF